MQTINFDEIVDRIVEQDPRLHRDAYFFLREALEFTQKQIRERQKKEPFHVTGQELLDGIREYALSQYGPMAKTVLNEWGIYRCDDFGDIVFNMVDHGLLSKTETDSREDFKSGYDFDEAFSKPYQPKGRAVPPRQVEEGAH